MQNSKETVGAEVPPIETERLILRRLRPEDRGVLLEIFSTEEVVHFTPNDPSKAVHYVDDIILPDEQDPQPRVHRFMIVRKDDPDGRPIGYNFLEMLGENVAEPGILLLPHVGGEDVWGKGYGTEADLAIMEYAFEGLGVPLLTAKVDDLNERSRNHIRKLGLIETGIEKNHIYFPWQDRWRTSHLFRMTRDEWNIYKQKPELDQRIKTTLAGIRINALRL